MLNEGVLIQVGGLGRQNSEVVCRPVCGSFILPRPFEYFWGDAKSICLAA